MSKDNLQLNCRNCGAPLEVLNFSASTVTCGFCGTKNMLADPTVSSTLTASALADEAASTKKHNFLKKEKAEIEEQIKNLTEQSERQMAGLNARWAAQKQAYEKTKDTVRTSTKITRGGLIVMGMGVVSFCVGGGTIESHENTGVILTILGGLGIFMGLTGILINQVVRFFAKRSANTKQAEYLAFEGEIQQQIHAAQTAQDQALASLNQKLADIDQMIEENWERMKNKV